MVLLMPGCQIAQTKVISSSITSFEIPVFPTPNAKVGEEFKVRCTPDTCPNLYAWFGKLMIFEAQLKIFREHHER